jgi:hypothetical protein
MYLRSQSCNSLALGWFLMLSWPNWDFQNKSHGIGGHRRPLQQAPARLLGSVKPPTKHQSSRMRMQVEQIEKIAKGGIPNEYRHTVDDPITKCDSVKQATTVVTGGTKWVSGQTV